MRSKSMILLFVRRVWTVLVKGLRWGNVMACFAVEGQKKRREEEKEEGDVWIWMCHLCLSEESIE